jgi:hypothetical protein
MLGREPRAATGAARVQLDGLWALAAEMRHGCWPLTTFLCPVRLR